MSDYGTATYGTGDYGTGSVDPEPPVPEVAICLTARVSGVDLNADLDGVERMVEAIDGWAGGADIKLPEEPRSTTGLFSLDGQLFGLPITVEGAVFARTHELALAERDTIGRLLADGKAGVVEIGHVSEPILWTNARRRARVSFDWDSPTSFRYRLQLLAADPYRYGTTSSASTGFPSVPDGVGLVFPLFAPDGVLDFGATADISAGLVTVHNTGSALASPVFEVAGPSPASGFVITDTAAGERIEFLSVIPAGASLRIDAADGSALINGVADRSGDLLVDAWPTVPAESSATFSFQPLAESSDATLTASVTATYW